MEKQILFIIKEYPKKRIAIKEIVTDLKKHGINLRATPELRKDFVDFINAFIVRGILIPLKNSSSFNTLRGGILIITITLGILIRKEFSFIINYRKRFRNMISLQRFHFMTTC